MMAPLHQDAGPPKRQGLLDLGVERLLRVEIPLGVPRVAVEGAEGAANHADVRVVDVAIDDVRDDRLGVKAPAHAIGRHAEIEKRSLAQEQQGVHCPKALAGGDALENRVDLGRAAPGQAQLVVGDALPEAGVDVARLIADTVQLTQGRPSPASREPGAFPIRADPGSGEAAGPESGRAAGPVAGRARVRGAPRSRGSNECSSSGTTRSIRAGPSATRRPAGRSPRHWPFRCAATRGTDERRPAPRRPRARPTWRTRTAAR